MSCLCVFFTEDETKRHFADELRRLYPDLWSSASMLHGEHHTYTGWRAALECFHRLVNDEKRSSARIPPTSSFQIGVRGQEKSCSSYNVVVSGGADGGIFFFFFFFF